MEHGTTLLLDLPGVAVQGVERQPGLQECQVLLERHVVAVLAIRDDVESVRTAPEARSDLVAGSGPDRLQTTGLTSAEGWVDVYEVDRVVGYPSKELEILGSSQLTV